MSKIRLRILVRLVSNTFCYKAVFQKSQGSVRAIDVKLLYCVTKIVAYDFLLVFIDRDEFE